MTIEEIINEKDRQIALLSAELMELRRVNSALTEEVNELYVRIMDLNDKLYGYK
jgi:uncharacterized Zn finger protein